jgi:inorganic pyrophosphatase
MGGMKMESNEDLKNIIEQMKDTSPTEEQINQIRDMAEDYSDKSEDEIFFEIIKINKQMKETMGEDEYNELIEKLNNIRPLLDAEQREKLDMVLKTIKKGNQ